MLYQVLIKKNHLNFSNQKGFTYLELVLVLAVLMLIIFTVTLLLNPGEMRNKSEDTRRINDLILIERSVIEYKLDYGVLPDEANVIRQSNVYPSGVSKLDNSALGWIKADLSEYTSHLPLDPINDDTYNYKYTHNGQTYEINAVLELLTEEMSNDGGNDPNSYEIGDNLNLISP